VQSRGDKHVGQLTEMTFERPDDTALDQMRVNFLELVPATESSVRVYGFIEQARHLLPQICAVFGEFADVRSA
jgi:hypothetical protein